RRLRRARRLRRVLDQPNVRGVRAARERDRRALSRGRRLQHGRARPLRRCAAAVLAATSTTPYDASGARLRSRVPRATAIEMTVTATMYHANATSLPVCLISQSATAGAVPPKSAYASP